jgi:hypothetical protein
MAANGSVSAGLRLVGCFQTFLTRSGPKIGFAWHRWSTKRWFHIKTSLIGHIPRPWTDLAATDEVSWLQTASVSFMAQIGWTFPNFFDWILLPKNRLGLAHIVHQELTCSALLGKAGPLVKTFSLMVPYQ